MPQSSEEFRSKFMINGSDGIKEAEDIIIKAGGSISKGGIITYEGDWMGEGNQEIRDAINYLVHEWDYAII